MKKLPLMISLLASLAMGTPAEAGARQRNLCPGSFHQDGGTWVFQSVKLGSRIVFSSPEVLPRGRAGTGAWSKVEFFEKSGKARVILGSGSPREVASPVTDRSQVCSPDGQMFLFWKKSSPADVQEAGEAEVIELKTGKSVDYSDGAHSLTEENFAGWKAGENHAIQILDGADLHPDGE